MTDMKNCRVCGAEFKRSRTNRTVNCPEHRGRRVADPGPRMPHPKAVEAKLRAYKLRNAGVADADNEALAEVLMWRARGEKV
jgi:DNA-directed RNA polymerase subunit RPC12/RpoP